MAKKQNPLLARYEAIWERRYQARLHESLRIGEDALLIRVRKQFEKKISMIDLTFDKK